ncbi:MAG: hypothetical protein O2960_17765 [Verrucomicrobia bacterium]|nr:hypothetical protein [Verrucomicrobiota bacterium]
MDRKAVLRRTEELCNANPALGVSWRSYQATINEQNDFFAEPAAYAEAPSGRNNLFQYFLLRFFSLTARNGYLSMVVPSGIYTDKGCAPIRHLFFNSSSVRFLYCFENRWPTVFTAVDNRFKFVVLGLSKHQTTLSFSAAFMQHDPVRLPIIEASACQISLETVRKLSPTGLAVIEFESAKGAEILERIYDTFPMLASNSSTSWDAAFTIEYMSNTDGVKFTPITENLIPVIAGKNLWQFDHAFSSLERGVPEATLKRDFKSNYGSLSQYRIAFRDIAASTNERTCIASMVYGPSVCLETARVITCQQNKKVHWQFNIFLLAALNSVVVDYIIRRMVTSHLSQHIMERLPIPRLGCGDAKDDSFFWPIVAKVLRLICTTEEYAALWSKVFPQLPTGVFNCPAATYGPAHERELRERLAESATNLTATWSPACGLHDRTPERRDTGDRAQTRAEIDALVAHLYGLTKSEFAYILDTFPGLRNKEMKAFGEFQSRRKALEEFDRFKSGVIR